MIGQLLGVRRPVGALLGCDLSQPFIKRRRQAGADQSGVKPPHSKELTLSLDRTAVRYLYKHGFLETSSCPGFRPIEPLSRMLSFS
jgi:hypothetical protein